MQPGARNCVGAGPLARAVHGHVHVHRRPCARDLSCGADVLCLWAVELWLVRREQSREWPPWEVLVGSYVVVCPVSTNNQYARGICGRYGRPVWI